MIKAIQHILVYIAGMVIVLHSLLPHQHHGEISAEVHEIQHQEATSLLDYIKLIFHEDMGEGHLEHVVVGQCLSLDIDSDYHHFADEFLDRTLDFNKHRRSDSDALGDFAYKEPLAQRLLIASTHLRGPPSIS